MPVRFVLSEVRSKYVLSIAMSFGSFVTSCVVIFTDKLCMLHVSAASFLVVKTTQ